MTAVGQEPTSLSFQAMSAFPPKADANRPDTRRTSVDLDQQNRVALCLGAFDLIASPVWVRSLRCHNFGRGRHHLRKDTLQGKGTRRMFTFRTSITFAVMAFILALAALLIAIQVRVLHWATQEAAAAYMDT